MYTNGFQREEILLSVKDVNLSFGEKKVLSDINFEVRNLTRPGNTLGQVISLVGRSGMGKSQMIGILSGLNSPTRDGKPDETGRLMTGTVLVNGDQKPVKAGDMGIVPQNYFMPEDLRIIDMLKLSASKNPKFKNDKKIIQENVDAYISAFELSEHTKKFPIQLSGGQKQRASISMQLLNGSNFLLMDEPYSGLDPIMIDKTTTLLQRVVMSDELITIVIVSHDLVNCIKISDTVLVLSNKDRAENTGATIVANIDLVERNLAFHDNIERLPAFHDTIAEVKSLL